MKGKFLNFLDDVKKTLKEETKKEQSNIGVATEKLKGKLLGLFDDRKTQQTDEVTKKASSKDISTELHNEAIYDSEVPRTSGTEFYDPDNEIKPKTKRKPKKTYESLRIGSNVPAEEVLKNNGSIKLLDSHNKKIIDFFCIKMEELIQFCFPEGADVDKVVSSNAYRVLSSGEHKIVKNFIKADRFQILGSEITAIDNPDPIQVGRFISILSSIVDTYPDSLVDNCGFLVRLLHLCHIPAVSKLFMKLCRDDPTLVNIQKYLIQFGFDVLVQREITNYRHTPFVNYYDCYASDDLYRAAAMYQIVANGLLSKNLHKCFATYDFLNLCETEYDQTEHVIEDEKWLVILAFYNQGYGNNLLNFVCPAVMKMREAKTVFYPCHAHALKFLAYMIKTSEEAEDLLIATDFFPQLLRILFIFYQSSFFQDALTKFMFSAITKEKICEQAVSLVVPAIMGMIEEDNNLPFRACACGIITECQKWRKIYPVLDKCCDELPDFSEFYEKHIVFRNLMMDMNYGEAKEGQLENLMKKVELRDASKNEKRDAFMASIQDK